MEQEILSPQKLYDLTENTLSDFTKEYPSIKTETDLNINADVFLSTRTFIETNGDIAHYIMSADFIYFMEQCMMENNYDNLFFLAEAAMNQLLWEYITDNYPLPDEDDDIKDNTKGD